jgi:cytochrome c6
MLLFKKLLSGFLLSIFLTILLLTPAAFAVETSQGAEIFNIHCAGCHIHGGNIIRRGKNLKKKALHRYGMDSMDAITEIVKNGKNNMSAFKDRLSEAEIIEVAAYVLEQAEKNWQEN